MTAVSIAKTFSASTKKLSANDRGRVLDFLTKFLDDPSSPGLYFETIEGGKDSSMKSARITQDLRTIIHLSDSVMTILFAGHHQQAYKWAERRRVEHHPVTGTLQIVETSESVQKEIQAVAPAHERQSFSLMSTMTTCSALACPRIGFRPFVKSRTTINC